MKKIYLLFALITASITCTAQKAGDSITYLTGTSKVPGYGNKTYTVYTPSNYKLVKTKDGKAAPVLSLYEANKQDFIGGTLENEKGQTTIIKNIKQTTSDTGTIKFIVEGKGFSMSFTIDNGYILMEENKTTVFYTEGVGIWKIVKK